MNWVGGSRNRIIIKQQRRKQKNIKEYFEKKKLKSNMNVLEVSSPKSSAVSLDIMNLHVANQITTKKDNTENMRKPVLVNITENVKTRFRRHKLELRTLSPRSQYKAQLNDLQNRLEKRILDIRRKRLSEKVKYQQNMLQGAEVVRVGSNMEQEDKRARAFSACPFSASSGFQSSNHTQLSEDNFKTNPMGNILERTCEETLQNRPENRFDQDPRNTKSPTQCIFRKSDTAPQERFESFHRRDHMNSARKNPVIMTSNELKNCEGIKAPIFDVVKETAELKASQTGSGCSFLALFEDENQPSHNNPSTKHFNLFVNQSSTDIFFIHSDVRNQMTDRNFSYDTRKAYPAVNAKKSSLDRHLEGIFTAPEHIFPKTNSASIVSYEETDLQNFHEGQHYFIPCETKEKHANLESNETFGHQPDQNNLKENVQNYLRKKWDDESVKETAQRQHQLFGFEKFTTAQEKESKLGVGSNLHEMETDVESPLSGWSHSYPPRQTETYLSCSSGTLQWHKSEEEDPASKKEYLNEWSLKTHDANLSASTEVSKSSHPRTVPLQPSSSLAREEANILQEKDTIFHATEEENKNYTTPSEGSSSHRALGREHVTHSTRGDVWSQSEYCGTDVEKVDVGTQCDTLWVCSCGGSLPTAHSPGGHDLPAREMPQPTDDGSEAGIAVLPCEDEYLSLAGRRTLEVLNYIDKMKERDKQ